MAKIIIYFTFSTITNNNQLELNIVIEAERSYSNFPPYRCSEARTYGNSKGIFQ